MSSNSSIFTTTIFGNSSGSTAEEQASKNTKVQETFLLANSYNTTKTKLPRVPSNQGKAKE
jgi:hypothetical protein